VAWEGFWQACLSARPPLPCPLDKTWSAQHRPRALDRARRRSQKVVETMVTDLGCAPPPKFPTRAVAGAWLALRAEAAALQELRRKVYFCHSAATFGFSLGVFWPSTPLMKLSGHYQTPLDAGVNPSFCAALATCHGARTRFESSYHQKHALHN